MRAVHRKRGDVIAKKATIIAVTNQKGGVGKSTTCENLGIGLAMEGKKILLVDTDPQGSLTIKKTWNYYTPEGREGIHNNLRINMAILLSLMRKPPYGYSAEYADNRISLFSAQWGKCAVTGEEFSSTHEIHCHHKLPRYLGGDDSYGNLILVKDSVHKLIHAINADTIAKYLELLQLDKSQLKKVNTLRELASLPLI